MDASPQGKPVEEAAGKSVGKSGSNGGQAGAGGIVAQVPGTRRGSEMHKLEWWRRDAGLVVGGGSLNRSRRSRASGDTCFIVAGGACGERQGALSLEVGRSRASGDARRC